MTRKEADELENAINDFKLALLEEMNYPKLHPYTGNHSKYDKVLNQTAKKRAKITKLINKLIKEV